jgi:hypothetical protein
MRSLITDCGFGGDTRVDHHENISYDEPECDERYEGVELIHAVHGEAEHHRQKVQTEQDL